MALTLVAGHIKDSHRKRARAALQIAEPETASRAV
jgi:hypothetical protein